MQLERNKIFILLRSFFTYQRCFCSPFQGVSVFYGLGVLMDKIQNHHVKKALSWLAGVASETLVIAAGAAMISGLWYLGFVVKIF